MRISRFYRFVVGTIVLFSLLVGGTRYAAQQPNQYVCIRLFRAGYTSMLFQIGSPNGIRDRRISIPSIFRAESPDGRYAAFDYPWPFSGGDPIDGAALYVGDLQTGQSVRLHLVIDGPGFSTIVAWSPDSQWIASVWIANNRDGTPGQYLNLSVSHPDGSEAHTISWENDPANPDHRFSLNGEPLWSADSTYVAINGAFDDEETASYTIFSVPDLRIVGSVPADQADVGTRPNGVWSPQGHRFAAVNSSTATLTLLDTGDMHPVKVSALSTMPVIWSPDAQYFISTFPDGSPFRLYYENGTLVTDSDNDARAQYFFGWMPDNQAIFGGPRETKTDLDLVAFDPIRRQYKTLATNVIDVFSSPNGILAYVRRQDSNETVVIVGEQPLATVPDLKSVRAFQWSPDRQMVLVTWATHSIPSPTHLILANADGSNRHEIVDDFAVLVENPQIPNNLHWLENDHWLVYQTRRADGFWLEMVDLQTGTHRLLVQLAAADEPGMWWEPILSPDGRYLLLNADGALYVTTFDDTTVHKLATKVRFWVTPVWSPDSKNIAYVHSPTQPILGANDVEDVISVVSVDGTPLDDFPVHGLVDVNSRQGIAWTKCD